MTKTTKTDQRRLNPTDWARAALDSIGVGGVDSVAVETIATALGATKGSFYWHYSTRDALIEAALELWEKEDTEAIIDMLETEPDPARRLRLILEGGLERGPTARVEIALLANPGHPVALAGLRRVAERRIAYMADQLVALGWGRQEARDRAVLIAYMYVGHMQVAHVAPSLVSADARRRQAALLFESLVGPAPS